MSKDLQDFAKYFMQGMQLGSSWADKWEQRAIEDQKNKLAAARNAAVDARENKKLDLYGQSVKATTNLANARAAGIAAKSNAVKGGGAGGGSDVNDMIAQRMRGVGLASAPSTEPAANNTTIINNTSDGPDPQAAPPPAAETMRRGGMVRKMAAGGAVGGVSGDFSLNQAEGYEGRGTTPAQAPPTAASAFGSGMSSAFAKYQDKVSKDKDKDTTPAKPATPSTPATPPTTPVAINTGAQGSGPNGAYTAADIGPSGQLGSMGNTGYSPDMTAGIGQTLPDMGGSANGATGSGGDSTGGASGTGGVGGSASDSAGGSAAAGTSGDAGSDGGGTYRRGGQVRRFASGGRVMEAIDTGTTGPMSGFGYQAAPPRRM